jgi:hypothetical protein
MNISNLSTSSFTSKLQEDFKLQILYTFLTNPQIVLAFINKARLLYIKKASDCITSLNTIKNATYYIYNKQPNKESSKLFEAGLEFLRLSSNDFSVYNLKEKIFEYIKQTTALKTGDSSQIALEDVDALEDIYIALSYYKSLYEELVVLSNNLKTAINICNSTDFSDYLFDKTQTDVLNLFNDIKDNRDLISNITVANELLASVATTGLLTSQSKILPSSFVYQGKGVPEQLSSETFSNSFPQSISGGNISLIVDGASTSFAYPSTSSKLKPFLISKLDQANYTISGPKRLYIRVTGIVMPYPITVADGPGFTLPSGVIPITLNGTYSVTSLISAINSQLNVVDTGMTFRQFGSADRFLNTTNRVLLYANNSLGINRIELIAPPSFFDFGTTTSYTAVDSCHDILGFELESSTSDYSYDFIKIALDTISGITTEIEDSRLHIKTNSTGASSSLEITSGILAAIGCSSNSPSPSYFEVKETTIISPPFEGTDLVNQKTITIDGTKVYMNGIQNVSSFDIQVTSQLNLLIDIDKKISLPPPTNKLDELISPLLNTPSGLQIKAAQDYLNYLVNFYTTAKASLAYSISTNTKYYLLANELITVFEQKNLTSVVAFLNSADFQNFFKYLLDTTEDSGSLSLTLLNKIRETQLP